MKDKTSLMRFPNRTDQYSGISRRQLLQYLGVGGLMGIAGIRSTAAQAQVPGVEGLAQDIRAAIDGQEMGFALRKLDESTGVVFSIEQNGDVLYPVASCFKAFLLYYYFWNTPQEVWQVEREFDPYRVAVFSDNVKTGVLIRDTGQYVSVYGNALEKFNDCLLLNLGLQHGLHAWDWEGNPMIGFTDPRFEPSETRFVEARGIFSNVDNVTTAADLANGYVFLAQAAAGMLPPNPKNPYFDTTRAQLAAQAALDLLSIPAENYKSPIERAFDSYTGKDGVLPPEDLAVGYVVNDAGIVTVGKSRYALALLSVGQTEYSTVLTLQAIAEALQAFEDL